MKKFITAMALITGAIILGACSKESSKSPVGSYTYKTSGTVTLIASQFAGLDAATVAAYKAAGINTDPVMIGLYPEQGQLHIMKKDGSDSDAIITFNDILGNADIATGTISGGTLTLAEGLRKSAQLTDGSDKVGVGIVAYSGSGHKYDDTLIIDLVYQGVFKVNGIDMTVVSSDVHCVAQAN